MEKFTCGNCGYFLQHYILDQGRLKKVYCGHCTLSTPRRKLPDAKPCPHYTFQESHTEKYVTREYLTKELLHRVLTMELLPEDIDTFPEGKIQ